jgi:hypothetical protein
MVSVHAQVARKYEYPLPPPSPAVGTLYKVFEQSEEQLAMARLNLKLQDECGEEFQVRFYSGEQLERIPRSILHSAAQCYADVFNESWGEDWTLESAMQEIRSFMDCDPDYVPVMTLLFREERVIGFCWGYIMNRDSLTDDSAPFSCSSLKRYECIDVARYWLNQVSNQSQLLSMREMGVLKDFRQNKGPFLAMPLFQKAKSVACNVVFFRTKLSSGAFRWSLGVGFVPLELLKVDGLVLMKGSIKYAVDILDGLLDKVRRRESQGAIIGNIRRYLCE